MTEIALPCRQSRAQVIAISLETAIQVCLQKYFMTYITYNSTVPRMLPLGLWFSTWPLSLRTATWASSPSSASFSSQLVKFNFNSFFESQIHLSVISMLIIIFQQYDFTRSSFTFVQVQSCLWFTRSTFWHRRFARRWASVRFHKRRWKTRRGWKRRWKMEETKLCGSIKARFFKIEKKLFSCECFFKCQTFKTNAFFNALWQMCQI